MTLCEETFEALGGCEKMRLKDLTTMWSREEIRPSFLTTQSHPKHRFHILNASNKILRTGASNRFHISVSSELWSSGMRWCITHERCGETAASIFKQNTVGSRFASSFYDDSLLRPLSSRTEHSRLAVHHCRNSSVLSLLSALLALFWCARVSSFSILVFF